MVLYRVIIVDSLGLTIEASTAPMALAAKDVASDTGSSWQTLKARFLRGRPLIGRCAQFIRRPADKAIRQLGLDRAVRRWRHGKAERREWPDAPVSVVNLGGALREVPRRRADRPDYRDIDKGAEFKTPNTIVQDVHEIDLAHIFTGKRRVLKVSNVSMSHEFGHRPSVDPQRLAEQAKSANVQHVVAAATQRGLTAFGQALTDEGYTVRQRTRHGHTYLTATTTKPKRAP